jgi:AsmA protein
MTDPDASTPRTPARRRRRWPWLLLGGFAALAVAAVVVVPGLIDVERYRGRVEEALRSATGWDVELGSMDLTMWRGLVLTVSPAKLSEPGGGSKIEIERIEVRASLLPLLRGRLDVRSIELVEADLAAVRSSAEKGWVVPLPAAPPEAELPDEEGTSSLRVTIGEVRVRNGRLLVEDRVPSPPLSFQVEKLRFAISPSGGDVSGRGDLQGGGELAVEGNLHEGLGVF